MKRILAPDYDLILENEVAVLRHVRPVVNGRLLTQPHVEVIQNMPARLELRYTAPALQDGRFGLELVEENERDRLWLRYWLEDFPKDQTLDSFGLQIAAVDNLRAYLRQGYTSWDGSYYVQPDAMIDFGADEPRPATGYAMTQILPRNGRGCLIIGFDRHDRYQQTFAFDTRQQPCSLMVQTWWDRKDYGAMPRCESERLVIFTHEQVEEGLREWARIVAAAAPIPPRVPGEPLTGWCSWYNLYASITEENIQEYLQDAANVIRHEKLPMRIFQIDDGFTPEMGDWLEVKPQFPRGMKPLLDDIRSSGLIPGLWMAPFMVGNRSRLYQEHPEWVVQDRVTGGPLVQMRFYGEFRWHKRSEEYYILDTTHPAAFAYLRQVFRTWRREWRCQYFKTDFMHFGSEHGPDRAHWHTPGMTRIEIWRHTAEMIREEIGDAFWLGCGCPLWVPVGLVDGVRIGRDAGVSWQNGASVKSLVRDLAARNFANNILWQSDPDCVLLRDRFHYLTEDEVRALALYAGMSGGVMMTSDKLSELSDERLRLWRLLLYWTHSGCDFPLLGQTEIVYERNLEGRENRRQPGVMDPVAVQVRQPRNGDDTGVIFLFNTGEEPVHRSYDLAQLGILGPAYLVDEQGVPVENSKIESISTTLQAHNSELIRFKKI
ncbi:MAG: glycoside hydrolase family 36 protein [Candidatus Promineifilaceae bacterium]|nr:glycoside hydrolase family 36 protein [Candidatus Promineifilaceae bacterium]